MREIFESRDTSSLLKRVDLSGQVNTSLTSCIPQLRTRFGQAHGLLAMSEGLSAYELQRAEDIARNRAVLAKVKAWVSLGLQRDNQPFITTKPAAAAPSRKRKARVDSNTTQTSGDGQTEDRQERRTTRSATTPTRD